MKVKHLVIAFLILLSASVLAPAQTPIAAVKEAGRDARAPQPAMAALPGAALPEEATPVLSAEVLLQVRNIQIVQMQRSVQMVQMESQYAKLQQAQDADAQRFTALLAQEEKKAGIDAAKWEFDPVSLKFVPRKPPAPATDAAPPKGGTPNSKPN